MKDLMSVAIRTFEEKEGVYEFEAIGLTTEHVTLEKLESINRYAPNQIVIYRHEHPSANPFAEVMGRITSSEIVDQEKEKAIKLKGFLRSKTPLQKIAVELVKTRMESGQPIGFSAGFDEYSDDADIYEWSLTHIPHCKKCTQKRIIMEDDDKIKELQDLLDSEIKKRKKLEDENKALTAQTQTKVEKQKFEDLEKEYVAVKKSLEDAKAELDTAIRAPYLARLKELKVSPLVLKTASIAPEADLIEEVKYWESRATPAVVTQALEETHQSVVLEDERKKWEEEVARKLGWNK